LAKTLVLSTLAAMVVLAGLEGERLSTKRAMASALRQSASFEPKYSSFEVAPEGLVTIEDRGQATSVTRRLVFFCDDRAEGCREILPTWETLVREAAADLNIGMMFVTTKADRWVESLLATRQGECRCTIVRVADVPAYELRTAIAVVPTTATFTSAWLPLRMVTGTPDVSQISSVRKSLTTGDASGRVHLIGKGGDLWALEKS
jgi:hypothetical protein